MTKQSNQVLCSECGEEFTVNILSDVYCPLCNGSPQPIYCPLCQGRLKMIHENRYECANGHVLEIFMVDENYG
jgi:hypothetical protein